MEHREADVVIVGAGLAGLTAARRVAQAGLTPIVLEARDRVGGRTVNEPIGDGVICEMGGQFVAARDTRLRPLLAELGHRHLPGARQGQAPARGRARRSSATRARCPRSPRARCSSSAARGCGSTAARRRSPRTRRGRRSTPPSGTARASASGSTSTSRRARAGHCSTPRSTPLWANDPHGMNILGALSRVHEAGSFDNLTGTKGGVLQDRVVGGATRAADVMAAELEVLLDTPVESVNDTGSRVEVEAGERARDRAARDRRRPARAGAPDPLRRRAAGGAPQGARSPPAGPASIKVAVVYDTPFWREQGPERPRAHERGPGLDHVRQLAAGRLARRADRLHPRPARRRGDAVERRASAGRWCSRPSRACSAR